MAATAHRATFPFLLPFRHAQATITRANQPLHYTATTTRTKATLLAQFASTSSYYQHQPLHAIWLCVRTFTQRESICHTPHTSTLRPRRLHTFFRPVPKAFCTATQSATILPRFSDDRTANSTQMQSSSQPCKCYALH